jgi:hypothetical protein
MRKIIIYFKAHPWILKYSDEDANVALWLAELFGFMIID